MAAKKLGVNPNECTVVEDAVNGVEAAQAAGMRCIAVAHTFSADRLRDADLVSEKISDIRLSDLAPHLIRDP